MLRIKQVRLLLNGRHNDGSKAMFPSNFKYNPYGIVLLAAISMSNFEYHTEKIKNATFISYYNLYKVAKFLGIDFERTKSAPYVYKKLIDRGHVKILTENNRTFITLTEKGKKSCEEKLEELQLLNEHFNENPSYRQKYKEGEDWKGIVKGAKPGSSQRLEVETEIDILIKRISQW
jgi:predicted transcriptional regulator